MYRIDGRVPLSGVDENASQTPMNPSRGRGYFAFPPDTYGTSETFAFSGGANPGPDGPPAQSPHDAESERQKRAKDEAWEARCRRDALRRRARLEQERAAALVGEMDWVRSGFTLRDAHGRKDVARTEELRAEVRRLDEERRVVAQWEAYEARWRGLLASGTPVAFADIPWPLTSDAPSLDALSNDAIAEFVFAPLRVRTNTTSRRDRVRASLLRWHPDKISSVLARVVPEDADAVREGVHAVFRCLKGLQEAERQA